MSVGPGETEHLARIVGRRHRHGRRPRWSWRQLARRRRLHLCDLALSRRQELPRRHLGPGDRPRRSRARCDGARDSRSTIPNDSWDIALTGKRIGRDFDPSLGFVPRRAVYLYELNADNRHADCARAAAAAGARARSRSLATDLSGRWESYEVQFAPINWRLRSGDRVRVQRRIQPANGWSSRSRSPTAW